jgi:COP9 signalosome complex subunit 12
MYLIPLRILRGHLPSSDLLSRFPAVDGLYAPFISAIRKGDIQGFDVALDKYERRLVDLNVWLTIEKAREICIRGLFRRVYDSFLLILRQYG